MQINSHIERERYNNKQQIRNCYCPFGPINQDLSSEINQLLKFFIDSIVKKLVSIDYRMFDKYMAHWHTVSVCWKIPSNVHYMQYIRSAKFPTEILEQSFICIMYIRV